MSEIHKQSNTDAGLDNTMAAINSRMDQLGDLPIFSTSLNKIRRLSSDPNSDAMEVAQAVMNDANLSAKLLRLANSAYYNRGTGRIGVLSRSVILLGFETVKNLTLTLKLIESFQHHHPSIDMNSLLVRSYLAASFLREVATRSGVRDVEESYVCALMHNLGEITVAFCLPDQYLQIQQRRAQTGRTLAQAEQDILGTTLMAVGQSLAVSWEFPATVTQSMVHAPLEIKGVLRGTPHFNRSLANLSNRLIGSLYLEHQQETEDFPQLMAAIATASGLKSGALEQALEQSFRVSCDLAEEYGLSKKTLRPHLSSSEDTPRNRWARQFAYIVSNEPRDHPAAPEATASAPNTAATNPSSKRDTHLQLHLIQEITAMIANSARLNEVFVKVLEGIQRGVGFDRALLCLTTPDRRQFACRIAVGHQREVLKGYFSRPLDKERCLFSKVLLEGLEVLVDDAADNAWRNLLPPDFVQVTDSKNFVAAALSFDQKPLGFFYADRSLSHTTISSEEYTDMLQFVAQARLALRLCT